MYFSIFYIGMTRNQHIECKCVDAVKGQRTISRPLLLHLIFVVVCYCYLVCLHVPSFDSQVQAYPMAEYESILNERGSTFHRHVNADGYLRSYFYKPAFHLLSVARATQMVEAHCHHEEPPKVRLTHIQGKRLLGVRKLPTLGVDSSRQRNIFF